MRQNPVVTKFVTGFFMLHGLLGRITKKVYLPKVIT